MLDVHPPHQPAHSWRDFAIHLATITVGLLIALGLEASVEALHHHELAGQARENIEHEIDHNQGLAKDNLANLQKALAAVDANLVAARQHRDNASEPLHVRVDAAWSSFDDAAWQTAHTSGAIAHMPLDDVQRYAGLYARQQELEREAIATTNAAATALAPLTLEGSPLHAAPEDVRLMMLRSADVKMQLTALRQLVDELSRQYEQTRGEAGEPASAAASVPAPAPASHAREAAPAASRASA